MPIRISEQDSQPPPCIGVSLASCHDTLRLPSTLTTLFVSLVLLSPALAQKGKEPRLPPDLANEHYGPHERHVLDLWKAKSDKPAPLLVFIHGGGFRAGSKESVSQGTVAGLLSKGVSVMAINYRFSPEVTFPAHYMDCARAIQSARLHAKEWNIDPKRVGASGGSAGAGTSLWIGFHDDMADPANADPRSARVHPAELHGGVRRAQHLRSVCHQRMGR